MRDTDLFDVVEHTPDAAFVVDDHGLMRAWNPAAERLLGHPAHEVVGQRCADVLRGTDSIGARSCAECGSRSCADAGGYVPNFNLQVRTQTGRRLWIAVSTVVAQDDSSGRALIVHLARDASVTQARDRLARSASELARKIEQPEPDPQSHPPMVPLTPQELRILRLLADGRSSDAITAQLQISPRTLRTHVHHINQKFRTRSRLATVMEALRRGMIAPPRLPES
jgi:PAS domain S-box-containing protein